MGNTCENSRNGFLEIMKRNNLIGTRTEIKLEIITLNIFENNLTVNTGVK